MEQPHPSAFSSYQDLLALDFQDIRTQRTNAYIGTDDRALEVCRWSGPWYGRVTSCKPRPRYRGFPTGSAYFQPCCLSSAPTDG